MTERMLVIGADAAGMSAASAARRLRPDPGDLEIVAVERGTRTSYSACGIPYRVAGLVDSVDALVARTPAEFLERFAIEVHTLTEATAIDLDRRRVEVRNLATGEVRHEGFDQLVLATGARPQRPPIPGIDLPWVAGVQTLDDGEALLAQAATQGCRQVVVVGGGYIGLEMAEAFLHWGAGVTVVDGGEQLMRTLDAPLAGRVEAAMAGMGIAVSLGATVEAFEDHRVVTSAGELPADLVVLGIGVTPNAELGTAAGLDGGPRGSVAVDDRQRTSADGVWAAGDCASVHHLVLDAPVHVALGTVANRTGRVAGVNLAGGAARFGGVVGTAITRVCDLEIARTGLTLTEAHAAGFDAVAADIESTTAAGYFPGSSPVFVRLVAERPSGRVLGGQIVGGPGAGKRIDTLATVVTTRLGVGEMVDLDLAYAPPFSPVWDPVVVAARRATHLL